MTTNLRHRRDEGWQKVATFDVDTTSLVCDCGLVPSCIRYHGLSTFVAGGGFDRDADVRRFCDHFTKMERGHKFVEHQMNLRRGHDETNLRHHRDEGWQRVATFDVNINLSL